MPMQGKRPPALVVEPTKGGVGNGGIQPPSTPTHFPGGFHTPQLAQVQLTPGGKVAVRVDTQPKSPQGRRRERPAPPPNSTSNSRGPSHGPSRSSTAGAAKAGSHSESVRLRMQKAGLSMDPEAAMRSPSGSTRTSHSKSKSGVEPEGGVGVSMNSAAAAHAFSNIFSTTAGTLSNSVRTARDQAEKKKQRAKAAQAVDNAEAEHETDAHRARTQKHCIELLCSGHVEAYCEFFSLTQKPELQVLTEDYDGEEAPDHTPAVEKVAARVDPARAAALLMTTPRNTTSEVGFSFSQAPENPLEADEVPQGVPEPLDLADADNETLDRLHQHLESIEESQRHSDRRAVTQAFRSLAVHFEQLGQYRTALHFHAKGFKLAVKNRMDVADREAEVAREADAKAAQKEAARKERLAKKGHEVSNLPMGASKKKPAEESDEAQAARLEHAHCCEFLGESHLQLHNAHKSAWFFEQTLAISANPDMPSPEGFLPESAVNAVLRGHENLDFLPERERMGATLACSRVIEAYKLLGEELEADLNFGAAFPVTRKRLKMAKLISSRREEALAHERLAHIALLRAGRAESGELEVEPGKTSTALSFLQTHAFHLEQWMKIARLVGDDVALAHACFSLARAHTKLLEKEDVERTLKGETAELEQTASSGDHAREAEKLLDDYLTISTRSGQTDQKALACRELGIMNLESVARVNARASSTESGYEKGIPVDKASAGKALSFFEQFRKASEELGDRALADESRVFLGMAKGESMMQQRISEILRQTGADVPEMDEVDLSPPEPEPVVEEEEEDHVVEADTTETVEEANLDEITSVHAEEADDSAEKIAEEEEAAAEDVGPEKLAAVLELQRNIRGHFARSDLVKEQAALAIQAQIRGDQVRNALALGGEDIAALLGGVSEPLESLQEGQEEGSDDEPPVEGSEDWAAVQIQAAVRANQVRADIARAEAAQTIQANVRGNQVRSALAAGEDIRSFMDPGLNDPSDSVSAGGDWESDSAGADDANSAVAVDGGSKALENQAGGHQDAFEVSDDGTITKKCNAAEYLFYSEMLPQHEYLKPLVPELIRVEGSVDENPRVVLRDLTAGYENPCIMDIKMGTTSAAPDASPEKRASMEAKDKGSTTVTLGARIVGFKTWNHDTEEWVQRDKAWGKSLEDDTFDDAIREGFFAVEGQRVILAAQFLQLLKRVEAYMMAQSSLTFISSSLLFVFDGAFGAPTKCNLKMIDFAHVFPLEGDGARDEGYLTGLRNVISVFESIARLESDWEVESERASVVNDDAPLSDRQDLDDEAPANEEPKAELHDLEEEAEAEASAQSAAEAQEDASSSPEPEEPANGKAESAVSENSNTAATDSEVKPE